MLRKQQFFKKPQIKQVCATLLVLLISCFLILLFMNLAQAIAASETALLLVDSYLMKTLLSSSPGQKSGSEFKNSNHSWQKSLATALGKVFEENNISALPVTDCGLRDRVG